MSNPRTPRQEEAWILAGRRWPSWTKPSAEALVEAPSPTATMIERPRASWCGLQEMHRTPEQILVDDQDLAERKASRGAQPPPQRAKLAAALEGIAQ